MHKERDASPKTTLLQHQKTVSENINHYKNIIENGPWIVVKFFSENSVGYLFWREMKRKRGKRRVEGGGRREKGRVHST